MFNERLLKERRQNLRQREFETQRRNLTSAGGMSSPDLKGNPKELPQITPSPGESKALLSFFHPFNGESSIYGALSDGETKTQTVLGISLSSHTELVAELKKREAGSGNAHLPRAGGTNTHFLSITASLPGFCELRSIIIPILQIGKRKL